MGYTLSRNRGWRCVGMRKLSVLYVSGCCCSHNYFRRPFMWSRYYCVHALAIQYCLYVWRWVYEELNEINMVRLPVSSRGQQSNIRNPVNICCCLSLRVCFIPQTTPDHMWDSISIVIDWRCVWARASVNCHVLVVHCTCYRREKCQQTETNSNKK